MKDEINRSAIMEIATYVIADSEIDFGQGVSIEKALPRLETKLAKTTRTCSTYIQPLNLTKQSGILPFSKQVTS